MIQEWGVKNQQQVRVELSGTAKWPFVLFKVGTPTIQCGAFVRGAMADWEITAEASNANEACQLVLTRLAAGTHN